MIAYTDPGGLRLLMLSDSASRLLHPVPDSDTGIWCAWSRDSRTVYFATPMDTAGHFTIKGAPAAGGPARTLVYGNDPVTQARRFGFAADAGRFYFPLAERKADIWVAEIRTQ
jgi:hypothetical protein